MYQFKYDSETGNIINTNTNKIAGYFDGRYHRIKYKDKLYLAHRLAWYLYYGKWPEKDIDHINRNTRDNRIANLREVTKRGNTQNRYDFNQGVDFHKHSKRWRSRIRIENRSIHLGYFDTEEQAQEAYINRAREIQDYGY